MRLAVMLSQFKCNFVYRTNVDAVLSNALSGQKQCQNILILSLFLMQKNVSLQ